MILISKKYFFLLIWICCNIYFSVGQSCTYRLVTNETVYNQAIKICQELGGSLAMIKDYSQQLIIERMIKDQYHAKWPFFWLGGDRIGKDGWYWLDGTPIPINPNLSNGIKWGRNQPNNTNHQFNTMSISNYGGLQIPGTHENRFYLEGIQHYRRYKSICEISRSHDQPCDSNPCFKNSTCVNVGCSYKCIVCNSTLRGKNCEFSYSPKNDVFNNTFTLTCQVKGYFSSILVWKIKLKTNNQYTKIQSSGSPFVIRNSSDGDVATFSLTMVAGGLCLDRSIIGCFSLSSDDTDYLIHAFNINQANYASINGSYFVFSTNFPPLTADKAQSKCNELGGNLASILNNQAASSLAKALDKENFLTSSLPESGAWIGLSKQSDGDRIWPNQQPVSFTNWAVDEPKSQRSCTYLSRDYTWKTEQCSGSFKAKYICEVYGNGYPRLNQVEAPCGNGNSSQLDISWKASPGMQNVEHVVTVRHKSETQSQSAIDPGTNIAVLNTFKQLRPNTKYTVTISVALNLCLKPISISRKFRTAYAAPGSIKSATVSKTKNNCEVVWNVDLNESPNIQSYIINVIKLPNMVNTNMQTEVRRLVGNESFLINLTSGKRFFKFPSLPNRRNEVEIFGQTCAGNGTSIKPSGTCITPVSGPQIVPSPELNPSKSYNTPTITITPPTQINGPINCYFVIGQYHNTPTPDNPINVSQSILNEITKRSQQNLKEGLSYLALTIPSAPNEIISLPLGDGRSTSCNVMNNNNIVSTSKRSSLRSRRNASSKFVFHANNIPLLSQKYYKFYVVSATLSTDDFILTSSNATSYFVVKQENQPLLLIIVSAACVLLLLILAIILTVCIRKKKNYNWILDKRAMPTTRRKNGTEKHNVPTNSINNSHDIQPNDDIVYETATFDEASSSSTKIPLNKLKDIYLTYVRPDNCVIKKQFQEIVAESQKIKPINEVGNDIENKPMNRYKNIVPFDQNRVILNTEDGNTEKITYINASHVDSYNLPSYFIATQGPVEKSINHFWTMIWQKKCRVIVMLTRLKENHRKKCTKYWPKQGSNIETPDFMILGKETVEKGPYIVSRLQLEAKHQANTEPIIVTHFQFIEWPDRGVPMTTTGLLRLHDAVIKANQPFEPCPIVVHCSAGVGRTGTLIALDVLTREMRSNSSVDIYSAVMKLRRQRCDMVQTQEQFLLIHKLIAEIYLLGETDFGTDDINSVMRTLETRTKKEFKNFQLIPSLAKPSTNGKSKIYENLSDSKDNRESNGYLSVGSQDLNNPNMQYTNVSFVEKYINSGMMIAGQDPTWNTTNDFWRYVVDNNVQFIVMLTPLHTNESETCFHYWPNLVDSVVEYNGLGVTLTKEKKEVFYTMRTFIVSSKEQQILVNQLHYQGWTSNRKPPCGSELISILADVTSFQQQAPAESQMMVHCSDGIGRTGVFCALINLIDRLNIDQRIDVFRAVKDLRDMRPNMVPSLDLYQFCYAVISDYLESFSLYSNFGT